MNGLNLAFSMQKATAKHRGIPFEFTFSSWMDTWEKSGKLDCRGLGLGRFVMARIGDVGPYAPGNVEIISHSENSKAARKNHPKSLLEMRTPMIGSGRGWTRVGKKFQVCVSRKYIGLFSTVELAEAAYKEASERMLIEASRVAGVNPAAPGGNRNE